MRPVQSALAAILVTVAVVALAACTPTVPTPVPPATTGTATATPVPDAGPALVPDGTAADNLAFFDLTNTTLIATNAAPDGRTLIDNLVAAGFTKADMEVTPDRTAIDLAADNIQFSVKFGDTCLIGQSGNVGYHSLVAPILATNTCLVGKTRAIDW